jgi:hypothetical protein
MSKTTALTALLITTALFISSIPAYAYDASRENNAVETASQTATPAETPDQSVINTPVPTPQPALHYTQAIGIDIGLDTLAIPGITYNRVITRNTRASIFVGAVYLPGGDIAGLTELNFYYDFHEYFYAGLGVNAALNGNRTILVGFFNPIFGMRSKITEDTLLFIESTAVFFSYNSNPSAENDFNAGNPYLIYKLGVRRFF